MGNREIISLIKSYKSLRAAASATGNRAEFQRCCDMIETLNNHLVFRA